MKTQKKEQIKFEKNIDGFISEKLSQNGDSISARQLLLLRVLILINNTYNMECITTNDKTFVWIKYSVIMDRVKGLNITLKMVQNDIYHLSKIGLIDRYVKRSGKFSQTFFHITDKTREIYLFKIK